MAKFVFVSGISGQIVATEDIPVHGVKKGDLGGYIESQQTGERVDLENYQDNAWVTQGATALNCRMYGNSLIESDNTTYDNYLKSNLRANYLKSHVIVKNSILYDNSKITSQSFIPGITDHLMGISVEQCSLFDNSIISTASKITGMKLVNNEHAKLVIAKGIKNYHEIESMSFKFCGIEYNEYYDNLYRIQATRDIPMWGIKKGDLGGLATSMTVNISNVSRSILEQSSWVDYDSTLNDSVISGDSFVGGGAYLKHCHIARRSYINGNIRIKNSIITKDFSLRCLMTPQDSSQGIRINEFTELYLKGYARLDVISPYMELHQKVLSKYFDIYERNYMRRE